MKRLLIATTSLLVYAGVASAQTNQYEGLVNVNIQDVLQDIAVDLNISDTNIPVTLQVPISVAANVCDVSVNVLSAQVDTGDATCAAVTGSQELTQIVQQEMNTGGTDQAADEPASSDDAAEAPADTSDDVAADDENNSQDDVAVDDDIDAGNEDTAADETPANDDVAVDEEGVDEMPTASTNSAREFAPGQQQQPANEVAPGKQDDPSKAAPGAQKRLQDAHAD